MGIACIILLGVGTLYCFHIANMPGKGNRFHYFGYLAIATLVVLASDPRSEDPTPLVSVPLNIPVAINHPELDPIQNKRMEAITMRAAAMWAKELKHGSDHTDKAAAHPRAHPRAAEATP